MRARAASLLVALRKARVDGDIDSSRSRANGNLGLQRRAAQLFSAERCNRTAVDVEADVRVRKRARRIDRKAYVNTLQSRLRRKPYRYGPTGERDPIGVTKRCKRDRRPNERQRDDCPEHESTLLHEMHVGRRLRRRLDRDEAQFTT